MGLEIYIIIIVAVIVFAILFRFGLKGKNVQNNQDNYTNYLMNNGLSENDLNVIFAIEDVFNINEKIIVTGVVVKGSIKIGDILNFVDQDSIQKQATVLGIEVFRRTIDIANTGDKVGIMLNTTDKPTRGSYLFRKD